MYGNMRRQMEEVMRALNEKIEKDMEFFSASGSVIAEKYEENKE